ncbi:hypothetical protein SAMN04487911_12242 [Arenibacter nanhaiticus]|uniref:Beta-lactamase-inhibitor-like, PepSY-like n=1 Tax=Arenibacter nanhaiticus TaxID=558155 RepID=A0A1M6JL49_9FLAO|nr:hypothetical protein [Arenibacter nanhaiticus]SHJ47427.1 hypothetical protein SAMN04487911_12242 [Arenibacter nanhaiticus]
MKKLFVIAVVSFGSFTAFAQQVATAADVATEIVSQEEFSEIEISALPEAVTKAVATSFPSASISKAYVNKKEQYKVEVALEDGTSASFIADKKGNWIEE